MIIRFIVTLLAACAVISATIVRGVDASSVPSAGPPAGAQLLARSVSVQRHPCTNDHSATCRGIVTVEVYKLRGPTAPPLGAVVPNVRAQVLQEKGWLVRHPFLASRIKTYSGCTDCGSWYFGCPNYLYESVQWDEQDYLGAPIYHVQQLNEDRVTCQYAWTIWRNINCATYFLFWSCEYPIPNSDFWDGYYHEDWSNTQLKYNPVPYDCELDTVYLRTYTAPNGYVQANAWRSMSGC